MNVLEIMGYICIVALVAAAFAWVVWVTESILDIKTYDEYPGQETAPTIPLDRIKETREEVKQLRLIGYATVDGKREIASRAVLQVLDKLIAEAEE